MGIVKCSVELSADVLLIYLSKLEYSISMKWEDFNN